MNAISCVWRVDAQGLETFSPAMLEMDLLRKLSLDKGQIEDSKTKNGLLLGMEICEWEQSWIGSKQAKNKDREHKTWDSIIQAHLRQSVSALW